MQIAKKMLVVFAAVGLAARADAKVTKPAAGGAASEKGRPVKNFHLYINDGDWEFADGEKTYVVGYVRYNDKFEEAPPGAKLPPPTIPSPEIRVKVGDEVHVFLHHAGHHHTAKGSAFTNVTHTIHFHGLDLVQAYDGVPGVPAAGLPDKLLSGVPPGDSYEYKFVAENEGTYLYHCHIDSSSHILLGMYGAFIVEGKVPNTIYGHKYDREYTLFFSEMDTRHNEAIRTQGDYDMLKWKSDYFLLNGRIFTADLNNKLSTIHDPRSVIKAKEGETVLLRLVEASFTHITAFHPHAYHMKVVGTDGRKLDSPYWKDTIPIASGERYDVLVPIIKKRNTVCLSCGFGKGLSVAHDHNMGGMVSTGKYPRGPLTIFAVE
jgi:FtsP/CotA-like multicopper oxidase with cupredoxin domain